MSSIKDRIAALNKKSEATDSNPSVRSTRATISDINTSESSKVTDAKLQDCKGDEDGAPVLSVKERLALMKAEKEKEIPPSIVARPKRSTVADIKISSPLTNPGGSSSIDSSSLEPSTAGMSIKERMALMQSRSASQEQAAAPVLAGTSSGADSEPSTAGMSIKERMALMQSRSASQEQAATAAPSPGKILGPPSSRTTHINKTEEDDAVPDGPSDMPRRPSRTSKLNPNLLGMVNVSALMPGGARPSFAMPPGGGGPAPTRARASSASASASGEMTHTTLTRPRRESKPRTKAVFNPGSGDAMPLVEKIVSEEDKKPTPTVMGRPLSMPITKIEAAAALSSAASTATDAEEKDQGSADTDTSTSTGPAAEAADASQKDQHDVEEKDGSEWMLI